MDVIKKWEDIPTFDSEEEERAFKIYCDQLASEVLGTAQLKAA